MIHEHGLVLGKFYPLHAGHVALLRTALARCRRVTVAVLTSSAESVPGHVRAGWIRDEVPGATVRTAVDDHPVDYTSPAAWDAHMAVVTGLLDAPVDAVLTSDPYGAELAARLGAVWEQVDPGRRHLPVAGRLVRRDPAGYWWALPAAVRAWFARRVVVLGAESTGTTTLADALAARFGVEAVPEFGRRWSVERPGGFSAPWHTAEFDLVAREQARAEDAAARVAPRPLVVCDTDPLATTVWHERYVGHRSPSVERFAHARVPDLYLLTGDEIPFVQDGLRDGEHVRHQMQDRFRTVLRDVAARHGTPWHELRGTPAERLQAAVDLVSPLVGTPRAMTDPLPEHGGTAFGADGPAERALPDLRG